MASVVAVGRGRGIESAKERERPAGGKRDVSRLRYRACFPWLREAVGESGEMFQNAAGADDAVERA